MILDTEDPEVVASGLIDIHHCIGQKSIFILCRRERKQLSAAEDIPDDLELNNFLS